MSTAVLFLLLTCAFLTLKVNICFFFVFVQQRQLADDEIDGELNSLHFPVFFICFPDYLHVQPLLQRAQQLFNIRVTQIISDILHVQWTQCFSAVMALTVLTEARFFPQNCVMHSTSLIRTRTD